MNEEIKAQWIKALRSGEYEQGKGLLRSFKDKYCCLGVLCDLYSKDTGVEWVKSWGGSIAMHLHNGTTPPKVDLWAGFVASDQYDHESNVGVYRILAELADLNDNGWTFEEIADYIERTL